MSHISANRPNIGMKLIVGVFVLRVTESKCMVIISVCRVCGRHFQNGRCEFSMSHISANNGARNLILVSISMFSGSI